MEKNEKQELELTATNVYNIFLDCLFREEELKDGKPICDCMFAEGIARNFYFNSERLKQHDEHIKKLIDQLPNIDEGPSFLNLCTTNKGAHWGEHINMEQLVALGIASGNLEYCLPKEMWSFLPGSVPLIIRTEKGKSRIFNLN